MRLARNAIRHIESKRSLTNLFEQHGNRTKTTLISDPDEPYTFLATPGVEVERLLFAIDSVLLATWQYKRSNRFELASFQRGLRSIRSLRRSHAVVRVTRRTRRASSVLRHG